MKKLELTDDEFYHMYRIYKQVQLIKYEMVESKNDVSSVSKSLFNKFVELVEQDEYERRR